MSSRKAREEQSPQLYRRLRAAWRRRTAYVLTRGSSWLLGVVSAALLVIIALDWLVILPPWGWYFAVTGLAVAAACVAYIGIIKPFRPYDPVAAALRLEAANRDQDLQSLLVSAVDFGDPKRGGCGSPRLMRQVRLEAARKAEALRCGDIARFSELRRPLVVAAVLLLAAGAAGAHWLVTRTDLKVLSGDLRIRRGEPVTLAAEIRTSTAPSGGVLCLREEGGGWITWSVHRDPETGRYQHVSKDLRRTAEYYFVVGRARSPRYRVTVVGPPVVTDPVVSLEYPPYTGMPSTEVDTLNVTVPEGTRIRWRLQMDRPVDAAVLAMHGEEALPCDRSPDGRTISVDAIAAASAAYQFHFNWSLGERKFADAGPKHYIQVIPDTEPRVLLEYPPEDQKATLSKVLGLSFRAFDDYGLAGTYLVYTLNQGAEQRHKLSGPLSETNIRREASWIANESIPDLRVGDLVTVAVEVVDARAPSPRSGRSVSRRIHFVSPQEYLQSMLHRRRASLARIRPMYMELRDAISHLQALDADHAQMTQELAVEAARQDMVDGGLGQLADQVAMLVRDLRSNPGVGQEFEAEVTQLVGRILAVRDGPLAGARGGLREVLDQATGRSDVPFTELRRRATGVIPQLRRAASELASLLLEAGPSTVAEVFAIQIADLISEQDSIREKTSRAEPEALVALSGRQSGLTQRARAILDEISHVNLTEASDALGAVRVLRAEKLLHQGGLTELLHEAEAALASTQRQKSLDAQQQAVSLLREAELKLRPDATLEMLVRARNLLRDVRKRQAELRFAISGMEEAQLKGLSGEMVHKQRAILRPLESLGAALGIEKPLLAAAASGASARESLAAGSKNAAVGEQQEVEQALENAVGILQARIDEIQEDDVAYRQMLAAAQQLNVVRSLRDRQAEVIERAQERELDQEDLSPLAGSQEAILADVRRFVGSLAEGTEWSQLLHQAIDRAVPEMLASKDALVAEDYSAAQAPLARAEAELAEAVALAERQVELRENIWELMRLSADLGRLGEHVENIGAEQSLLRDQTEAATQAGATVLDYVDVQELLRRGTRQAADLMESAGQIEAIRKEMGAAEGAMAAASDRLRENDGANASPLQRKAEAELMAAKASTDRLVEQTRRLVQMARAMQQVITDAATLLQRQISLRKQTERAQRDDLKFLSEEQAVLEAEAKVMADEMPLAQDDFALAEKEMHEAVGALAGGNQAPGVEHQKRAEAALRRATDVLIAFLETLEEMSKDSAFLVVQEADSRLDLKQRLLFLALDQQEIRLRTVAAPELMLPDMADPQGKLRERAGEILDLVDPKYSYVHEGVTSAMAEMQRAIANLRPPKRDEAVEAQRKAEVHLRRTFAKLLADLYRYLMEREPNEAVPETEQTGMSPYISLGQLDSKSRWRAFVAGTPELEAVERNRSEWEPLSERDRDALNENFARELPLEYRRGLMQYYRALSR